MVRQLSKPGNDQGEIRVHTIDGAVVYARRDKQGKPALLDAIDTDARKVREIADHLWRRGFGVMRQRHPRAGKVFYLFKAIWAEDGEPPDDPFDDRD
jgi:hypothetical protein